MARMAQGPLWAPASVIGTPSQTIKIKKWANGQTNSGNRQHAAAPRPVVPKPKEVTLMLPGEPKCPLVW